MSCGLWRSISCRLARCLLDCLAQSQMTGERISEGQGVPLTFDEQKLALRQLCVEQLRMLMIDNAVTRAVHQQDIGDVCQSGEIDVAFVEVHQIRAERPHVQVRFIQRRLQQHA